MKTHRQSARVAVSLLMTLAWCGAAAAQTPAIKDDAGLFSDTAISKASQAIRDIKSNFNKDLYIETFKAVPANKIADFKNANAKQKEKLFDDWALFRALKALKIDGIYVHIVKTPEYRHLEVVVTEGTLAKAFKLADRAALRDLWLARLKAGEFNKGLDDSVILVKDRLEKNLGPIAAAPAPVPNAVRDYANLFSTAGRARATEGIKTISEKFKVPVTVETFAVPPVAVKTAIDKDKGAGRDKAIADWLRDRQQASKVDGIHLLLCKDPKLIRLGIGPQTEKKAFTPDDRDKVVKVIVEKFKADQFDKGIEDALALMSARVASNIGPLPTPALALNALTDHARLFSPEVVVRVNKEIQALSAKHKTDLTIETFAEAPPELSKFDGAAQSWALARRADAKARGIYVAIINGKPTVTGVDGDGIPDADRKKLGQLLEQKLSARQGNQAIEEGVRFVADTLAAVPIRDQGGFFSDKALAQGNEAIRNLRQRYHRDVIVETYKSVPPELAEGVNLKDAKEKDKLFATWAKDRVKASGRDAVLILICKDPTMLKVEALPDNKWFDQADAEALKDGFLTDLKDRKFDKALADGLAVVSARLEGRPIAKIEPIQTPKKTDTETPIQAKSDSPKTDLKGTAAAKGKSTEFNAMWIVYAVGAVLVLIILIAILRAIVRGSPRPQAHQQGYQQPYPPAQQPYPPQQQPYPPQQQPYPPRAQQPPPGYGGRPASQPPGGYPQAGYPQGGYPQGGYPPQQPQAPAQGGGGGAGGGGGGFVAGMLGGAAGAVAGNILYDKFARGGGQPAGAAPPPPAGTRPPASYDTGRTADYGNTGGGSSGGDQSHLATGGDWSSPQETTGGGGSAGGDWGEQPAPAQDAGGGDWADQQQDAPQPDTGGGDWGGGDAGGGDAGGGDAGGGDAGGGDWGGSADAGGGGGDAGGGDWGGGGDAGGGGGDAGGGDY